MALPPLFDRLRLPAVGAPQFIISNPDLVVAQCTSGIVGAFFRQFALTIAVSTLISTFNSLTLSPALCALLLKAPTPAGYRPGPVGRVFAFAFLPFTLFGRLFGRPG